MGVKVYQGPRIAHKIERGNNSRLLKARMHSKILREAKRIKLNVHFSKQWRKTETKENQLDLGENMKKAGQIA